MAYKFDLPFQEHILASLLSDEEFLKGNSEILNPEYFGDDVLRDIATTSLEFFKKHKESPTKGALLFELKKSISPGRTFSEYTEASERLYDKFGVNSSYYQGKAIEFAKSQAVAGAIRNVQILLDSGEFGEINKVISNALKVGDSLTASEVYNYWEELARRVEDYGSHNGEDPNRIPTGLSSLDTSAHGGLAKGELGLVIAPPKHGKTSFLVNLAVAALEKKKKVFYFTLELSKKMIAHKVDTCISGKDMAGIKADRKGFLKEMEKKRALLSLLHIVEFPTKALTIAKLEGILNKANGCDLVLVDYGQLLKPAAHRGDRRHEITDLYENLRRVAGEMQVAIWTAHQGNRGSYGSKLVTMEHVAEDFNIVAISDIAVSLNQTEEEHRRKRLRVYVVGSRIGPSNDEIDCWVDWKTSKIKEVGQDEVLGE